MSVLKSEVLANEIKAELDAMCEKLQGMYMSAFVTLCEEMVDVEPEEHRSYAKVMTTAGLMAALSASMENMSGMIMDHVITKGYPEWQEDMHKVLPAEVVQNILGGMVGDEKPTLH
jgi:hypothetical protein